MVTLETFTEKTECHDCERSISAGDPVAVLRFLFYYDTVRLCPECWHRLSIELASL